MFSDQTEQQAREDLYGSDWGIDYPCHWPECEARVRTDEALCPEHEREADEDAMDDMLDAARKYPSRIMNDIMGNLAIAEISGRDYFCACRLLQSCMFQTHFREPK